MTLIPCDLLAADRGVTLTQLREWAVTRSITQACDLRTRPTPSHTAIEERSA